MGWGKKDGMRKQGGLDGTGVWGWGRDSRSRGDQTCTCPEIIAENGDVKSTLLLTATSDSAQPSRRVRMGWGKG
ncbi:hypothetical protein CLOM_g19357 [Closterium sp. NIES-68]|nr:hypothetical protein CLOM_g19357 [Closterium sp. NIES-68]GJP76855.1 hypothetical protein CLOP_g7305 [Closterium sp. NIES-67]